MALIFAGGPVVAGHCVVSRCARPCVPVVYCTRPATVASCQLLTPCCSGAGPVAAAETPGGFPVALGGVIGGIGGLSLPLTPAVAMGGGGGLFGGGLTAATAGSGFTSAIGTVAPVSLATLDGGGFASAGGVGGSSASSAASAGSAAPTAGLPAVTVASPFGTVSGFAGASPQNVGTSPTAIAEYIPPIGPTPGPFVVGVDPGGTVSTPAGPTAPGIPGTKPTDPSTPRTPKIDPPTTHHPAPPGLVVAGGAAVLGLARRHLTRKP